MSEYILKGKSGIDKQLNETIYKLCETIEEDDARYEARKREIIRVLDLLLKEDDTRHIIRELIELIITRTTCDNSINTCELVNELKKREGVEEITVEPYATQHIIVDGPAVILKIID